MSEKDTKAKQFLADNKRFADLFNVYLFHGEQIIKAEELQERDTTALLSLYGVDKKEVSKQRWRDLLKSVIIKSTKESVLVLLGVENQSDIHYAMPVKAMIYDAMNYGMQVNEAARQHKTQKEYESSAEFLSGFKKNDTLTPIITLTVYWGADEWDAPRCLHDMFDKKYEKWLPYVDNYHLHLLVPNELNDFTPFQTELGEVLEFIKASSSEAAMDKLVHENPAYRRIGTEALSAINVFTGVQIAVDEEGGKMDMMCKAWEDHKQSGIREGIEQGIEQGKLAGIEEGTKQTVDRLAALFNLLNKADRLGDYAKAMNDREYLETLYKEFGL